MTSNMIFILSFVALLAGIARADQTGAGLDGVLNTVPLPEELPSCPVEKGLGKVCAWTGDCELEGCADKCVLNSDIGSDGITEMFSRKLLDAIDCPLMAFVLSEVVSSGGVSRRLQEQGDVVADAMNIALASVPPGGLPRFTPRALLQAANAPGKGCPTPEDVQEAAPLLFYVASFFQQAINASGDYDALEVDSGSFEEAMVDMFITLMADPASLNEFFENECKSEVVTGELSGFYATLQDVDGAEGPVAACRDTDGAAEAYFSGLKNITDTCSAATPTIPLATCIGDGAAPLDDACMAAYGALFELSTAEVAAIQEPYKEISNACRAIRNAEDCKAKNMPQVDAVETVIAAAAAASSTTTTAIFPPPSVVPSTSPTNTSASGDDLSTDRAGDEGTVATGASSQGWPSAFARLTALAAAAALLAI